MKFVLLTNNFPPKVCGVGDYSYYLSQELIRRGHQIHVICNEKAAVSTNEQLKVYPIISEWTTKGFQRILEKIQDIQPDWVLVQYVPYSFHPRGLPIALVSFIRKLRRLDIRSFVFFHELYVGFNWKSPKYVVLGLTQRWIAKKLCQYANKIATSIDHYVEILQKWRADIHQIPIGSNIPFDTTSLEKDSTTDFTITTFGIREVAPLLDFFGLIKAEIPQAKLIICGKQTSSTTRQIHKDICFSGYLPAAEIAQILANAQLFIMPDIVHENGGGGTCLKSSALSAAFAAGLPIVGMKGQLNGHLLQAAEHVYLVDYYDYEDWKKTVLEIYTNRQKWQEMRASIHAFYEQHLSWEQIGDRYLETCSK